MTDLSPIHRITPLLLALVLTGITATSSAAPKRPSKPPPALPSFIDHLDSFDSTRWMKADGWKNGPPFDNSWRAENIGFANGLMGIRLDDKGTLGEPYASGNYQSLGFHGYGCYEASFRPVARPGVITSFFTFAGPYDNGGNGKHNEIDVEFLGYDTRVVQFNFYTNDDTYSSRNEQIHDLGFDASEDFHRYGFKWSAGGIAWYVDGQEVYAVANTPGNPTPSASDSLQKIMMNVWPVDATASGWAGDFEYPGQPLTGSYRWVRFEQGENCTIGAAPEEPEPPTPGDPTAMRVAGIALSVDGRATQVIARVTILDGSGAPVPAASVSAAWSGLISGGDTRRDTDASGVSTFYSARTKGAGTVSFCVTGVTKTGLSYASPDGKPVCASITK